MTRAQIPAMTHGEKKKKCKRDQREEKTRVKDERAPCADSQALVTGKLGERASDKTKAKIIIGQRANKGNQEGGNRHVCPGSNTDGSHRTTSVSDGVTRHLSFVVAKRRCALNMQDEAIVSVATASYATDVIFRQGQGARSKSRHGGAWKRQEPRGQRHEGKRLESLPELTCAWHGSISRTGQLSGNASQRLQRRLQRVKGQRSNATMRNATMR